MRGAHNYGRYAVTLGLLLLLCPCAFALDPALDVSQYSHTAWTVREGFFKGGITAVTQTPDGYLWLGTEFGLLLFDGVRTIPCSTARKSASPCRQYLQLARRERWDSLDRHLEWAC